MRQLLLYGFCLFFSTFLTAQKTNNQDVENNLKSNSKVASFFMNKDRKTPSMIKMNPEANLRIENVPGFLTSALQIKSSAFQFTLTDRLVSKNGSETITFSASYNGVNVIHSKYKAFVKDGDVKFISMEHYSFNEKMNKSAVLTKDQARGFATSHVGADVYVWETISNLLSKTVNKKEVLSLEAQYKEVFPVGELVYVDDFMTSESNLKLAYRFNMYASEPIYRANVFIDAQSGKILLEDAIIKHANEINEKRTSLGITAGITYGPTSATVATGNTRYAGIRNFETTLDETSTTARYSLDGTIDLLPYGIVDDPLTTEVNEALVLNETRSLDGVGGIPLGVNGIPSYSIYDGFSRDEEGQLVAEIGDNNWTTEEHYRNDFSIPYPAHKEEKNDDTALDAHWGAEIVIRYWADIHGRSSHNNKGAKVISYVHSGQQFDNAFWNGTAMTYGDGSYQGGSNPNGNFAPLTSLDVCGHEIGHGVCSATSDLVYARESGAMNEGFSDIWAAAVEAYVLRDIDGDLPYDPWGIGEQIDERDGGLAPGEAGSQALRWMDDPNAAGDPSFYGGEDWNEPECGPPSTANDQCGVHSNSGVLNKWYYLLVAGSGKELTLGKDKILADPAKQDRGAGLPYTVEALGFIIADQITFKAEVLLTSNAKFAEMREASILVAGAEYSAYEVEQVTNAWFAVGVGEQYVAPGADILLYENSNVSLTQENTLGDGCNEVNTFTIEVTAASITTPQTAVFTFDESTATLGQDFDISPASLTFPVSTTSLTQAITVTIYNDAVVEGAEVIQMNFTNGSAETDIRKQVITVIDDDYIPAIGVGEIELLNETFDTTDTPTGWFVSSEFDVNTWAFNGVGLTSFGRAYVIPAALNPDEPTYNGTADSSIHLLSSPLDARGMTSVNVSFDWTAGGENDGTALFDWGEFMYTLDGVTYESVERFSNAGLPGSGTGPQASGTFEALMPELDGTAFTLIWRWYNDALVQGTYSFSIDNVLVTGLSAPVEGDLTHSDNAIVNQESQVYFISNQDSDVMAVIENASADLGCVSLEVVETGFGGVFPNTIDGAISHAGKVIKITADGENATYDVTLYYTDSELSNIQDPNSLKMMKVNSADIEDASDNSSVNYAVSGALLLENTDRSYRSYKGTFTGNGVIGLVSTSETLAATSFNVSQFNVFPTVINNSEIVHITNSKTFIEKVDIYSINGKLVKSFDFNSKYTVSVPVTKLSSGMYFLNINKDRSNTHKFIVK
jgi:Zn-dependent metalloprotease